ncbi:hypothetical protein M9458_028912, partial [Cirrhinus mrigala]
EAPATAPWLRVSLQWIWNFEWEFEMAIYANMPPLLLPSSELPVSPVSATLTLLPRSPLSPGSPSAQPQPSICAAGSTQVCQSSSASWLEDSLSPPPASESWTPPRPVNPAAPLWLLAPSSPSSFRLRLGLSSTICHLGTPLLPLCLVPPALLGSSFPSAPPWSSVASAPLWPSGSSSSPWLIGSPSPPRVPPPPAPTLSAGALESSTLPPPWLLPLSAPPWVAFTAWVPPVSTYSKLLLSSLSFSSTLAPSSVVSTLDSVCHPPLGCPSFPKPSPKFPPVPPFVVPVAQGRYMM